MATASLTSTREDCNEITLTSTLFTDGDVVSFTVEYKTADNGAYAEISKSWAASNNQTISPADLSQTDEFCDLLYCFKITATLDDDSTEIEYAGVLVDCLLQCEIAKLLDKTNYHIGVIRDTIDAALTCNICDDCGKAYELLEWLVNELEGNDCLTVSAGCS